MGARGRGLSSPGLGSISGKEPWGVRGRGIGDRAPGPAVWAPRSLRGQTLRLHPLPRPAPPARSIIEV